MIGLINRVLLRAQRKPLVMVAWALCATSFWFVWDRERTIDQSVADLRRAATDMEIVKQELAGADELVDVWRRTLNDVGGRHVSFLKSLGDERFRPDKIDQTTAELIEELKSRRGEISQAVARINNSYFGTPALQELRTKLLGDIIAYDESLERSAAFLQAIRTDMPKASAMLPDFTKHAFEDQRKGLEGEGRDALIQQTYDRTRLEFNASVRVFNERRAADLRSSRLEIAAWTYIGAWIGGVGGWCLSRWRRGPAGARSKNPREGDKKAEPAASATRGQQHDTGGVGVE